MVDQHRWRTWCKCCLPLLPHAVRRLVSHVQPARNKDVVEALSAKKATVVGMDCIPRQLSRAQTFDSLSSQANIAGARRPLLRFQPLQDASPAERSRPTSPSLVGWRLSH